LESKFKQIKKEKTGTKKPFRFARKTAPKKSPKNQQQEEKENKSPSPSSLQLPPTLSELSNERKVLKEGGKEDTILLTKLTDCTIFIPKIISTLTLTHLNHSKIYTGPVSGPVFVENCQNCVIYCCGRQIRIHETSNCTFSLFVTSKPTIENCHDLRFSPYAFDYEGVEKEMKEVGFVGENMYNKVQDFQFLTRKENPNWKDEKQAERVTCTK